MHPTGNRVGVNNLRLTSQVEVLLMYYALKIRRLGTTSGKLLDTEFPESWPVTGKAFDE